jgi:hypothetical protein
MTDDTINADTADTEGNAVKPRFVEDGVDTDDAQGNAMRAGKAFPGTAKPGRGMRAGRLVKDDGDADDTEGNARNKGF